MEKDMCVGIGNGFINLRVGAVIIKDGKFLMAGNDYNTDYLYSVGGRIKFGETAEEAIVREVYEETGVRMEVDRLGFVHENYFRGDMPDNEGQLIYEISFYFYMKVPEDFDPVCESMTESGYREFLVWVSPEDPRKYYPGFFRTELSQKQEGVKYFIDDER